MDVPLLQAGPVPPAPLGNPILNLVAALLRASIYVLQILRQFVAFVTLTIPSLMVRILGWSWTLQVSHSFLPPLKSSDLASSEEKKKQDTGC